MCRVAAQWQAALVLLTRRSDWMLRQVEALLGWLELRGPLHEMLTSADELLGDSVGAAA